MHILIIDDEKDIKSLFEQKFRQELKNKEYEFSFCYSAEEAIEFLKNFSVADIVLILSDINMPGMSGLELLKYIKKNYPYLKVFMITAYDEELNYSKAMDYGADNYITKPIDFELLKKSIKNIVNQNL